MNIYKLQYDTKAEGDADLLAKGTYEVIEGEQVYRNGTQAIVYLGKIVEVPATDTTPPIYYDGVFYDLMTTEEFDFGIHELFPRDCVHSFLGYEKNAEGTDVDPDELIIE
jgi:hypothetical protein